MLFYYYNMAKREFDYTPRDWGDIKQRLDEAFEKKKAAARKKVVQMERKNYVYNPFYSKKQNDYARRAKGKGLEMSLTVLEFEFMITSECYYCGGSGGGIDRIDSSLGYTTNNTRPCCFQCNLMKYTYSTDSFLEQIKKIHNNLNL